jgi:pantoate--beta-alanine ligase
MLICRTINEYRAAREKLTGTLGVIPTMGYLHEGHLSLVAASRADNTHTAATLFVNPTQFNNPNDLAAYPRDEARDFAMFESAGVELIFAPNPDEMYPPGFQTSIEVAEISQGLEGEQRPGHFKGVATVVCKLLNITQPTRAYFGQKDAQQVAVIRQMVRDLNLPVELVVCPTMRESDGLAMSSRNARLSTEDRRAAPILYRALTIARNHYDKGERDPIALRDTMRDVLGGEPAAQIEYVSCADAESLKELEVPSERPMLLSLAVRFGDVRLIDNVVLG